MHLLPTVLLALAAAAATTTREDGMGAPEDDSVYQSDPAPGYLQPNYPFHGAIGAATGLIYKMIETWARPPQGHQPQRMLGSNQPPGAGRRASLPGQSPARGETSVAGRLRTEFQRQDANPNSQPKPGRQEQLPSSPGRDLPEENLNAPKHLPGENSNVPKPLPGENSNAPKSLPGENSNAPKPLLGENSNAPKPLPEENSNAPEPRSSSAGRSAKVRHDPRRQLYPGGPVQWTIDRNIADVNSKLKMYMNSWITPLTQWQICMREKLDPKGWTLMDYFKEDLEPEEMEQIKQMEDDCIDEVNRENKVRFPGLELEPETTEEDSLEFSVGDRALKPSPNPLAAVSAWAACVQKCTVQGGANLVGSIPRCFDPTRCRSPFGDVNPVDAALRAYQEHKKHIDQAAATAGVALAVAMLIWLVLTSLAAAGIAVAAAAVAAGVGAVTSAM